MPLIEVWTLENDYFRLNENLMMLYIGMAVGGSAFLSLCIYRNQFGSTIELLFAFTLSKK
jgi:hypothetical protein